MAKLGIICSIYNDTQYIESLISSCNNISERDLNIYFVNDHSTIDISAIFENIASRNERFHFINSTSNHFGLGSARNFMLDKIDDEFVGFIDADDFVAPKYHETLLKIMDRYNLDCVKTGWTIVSNDMRQESQLEDNIPKNQVLPGIQFFDPYNKSNLFDRPHSWAGIYRKTFLDEHNIRFSNLMSAEDRIFWLKCLFFSKRTMAIPITKGYYYRKEDDESRLTSVGNKTQNEFFNASLEMIAFAKNNVHNEGVWRKLITQIIALTDYHFRNRGRLSEIALFDLYFKASSVIKNLKECPQFEFIYSKLSKNRKDLINLLDSKDFIYE